VDIFAIGPFMIPIPTFYPLKTYVENMYRAVTCTKLINYHAIEDSVIVMDKGSVISTKTIAYDAETGSPIVSRTANEFNDPIYNVSYPAYWAYSGTGLAYNNINREFTNAGFTDGRITLSGTAENISTVFESGDELYVTSQSGAAPAGCINVSAPVKKLWAFDLNKNTTALTMPVKDLIFIDSIGRPYTMSSTNFRIIRSGKRNNIGLTISAAMMKNPIQNGSLLVNNAANVVTASAVEYKEKWQMDADLFKRYEDIVNNTTCVTTTQLNCNGYLEKSINPYLKGLIGNYKPYHSYTYYGDRNEADPAAVTTIRKNGYINNFGNFWNFNSYNNVVPDYLNTKWVWNSQLTKVNAKGQELETVDALNRYTAAQIGFAKNMPVAMVQNARYGESFAESFEDGNYQERINAGSITSCDNDQYIKFAGAVNGDNVAVKAHSGQQIMQVNAGSQTVKNLNVRAAIIDNNSLLLQPDTSTHLENGGGDINIDFTEPYLLRDNISITSDFTNAMVMNINPLMDTLMHINGLWYRTFTYDIIVNAYIDVPEDGMYYFSKNCYPSYPGLTDPLLGFSVYDLNGNSINYEWVSTTGTVQLFKACLKKGHYAFVSSLTSTYTKDCGVDLCAEGINLPDDNFSITIVKDNNPSNGSLSFYKTLSTVNGCISSKPIPATDSMKNAVFALVPGKKMQFSAWVHEDCTAPCTKTDFTSSNIQVWANGSPIAGSTVQRTGNIIEGWQKIEGDFTVPANATTAELRFINSNAGAPMYVDDIRLHPFNANMKSYVYDPRTLRLSAELDENNYASFYEYDEEGQLIRVKKETIQGIKTIKETRSAKQRVVTDIQ
jgi:hypothetical protein